MPAKPRFSEAWACAFALLLCGSEAIRVTTQAHSDADEVRSQVQGSVNRTSNGPIGIGMQAVSVYAAGNCQFLPLFDVAHFLMQAEGAAVVGQVAVQGAGLLAKPAVVAAAQTGAVAAVQMGTKAGLLTRIIGTSFPSAAMAGPVGMAISAIGMGLNAYQLWQFHQAVSSAGGLAKFVSAIPPFSHGQPPTGGGLPPASLPPAVLPPTAVGDMLQGGPALNLGQTLGAGAVLLAASSAIVYWYQKVHYQPYDLAICPRSHFVQNPTLDVAEELNDQAFNGMPQCRGLRSVKLPTFCGDDLECQHASCQQACCDANSVGKTCSMYQFDGSSPLVCWLGNVDFTSANCDAWAGYKATEDGTLSQKVDGGLSNGTTTQPASKWYGGIVTADVTGCGTDESLCPVDGRCVAECSSCDGFSVPGKGRCTRSAEQAICHAGNWKDTYAYQESGKTKNVMLNETQCVGLKRVKVKLTEQTGFNGHAVCQELCCGDPSCVLYQVNAKYTKKQGLTAGTEVHCWLGKSNSGGNHDFTCGGSGWMGDIRQWVGGSLERRGCQSSEYACVISNECVESCSSQCPGAATSDDSDTKDKKWKCVPDEVPAVKTDTEDEAPFAVARNILTEEAEDNADVYYLSKKDTSADKTRAVAKDVAQADTLLMLTQNKRRLVTKASDDVCAALAAKAQSCRARDGGCQCQYSEEKTCSDWYEGPNHLRMVLLRRGMMLLTQEGCVCTGRTCSFDLLSAVPSKIKVKDTDTTAINIV